ncbi:ATP-binding protein [Sesbania bispinosa]|nr:ATP-binding protein [Sesbania bispinosa]
MISNCSRRGLSHQRRCERWECDFSINNDGDDNNGGNDRNFAIEVIATTGHSSWCSAMEKGEDGGKGDHGSVATEVTTMTCARPGTAEPVEAEPTMKVSQ